MGPASPTYPHGTPRELTIRLRSERAWVCTVRQTETPHPRDVTRDGRRGAVSCDMTQVWLWHIGQRCWQGRKKGRRIGVDLVVGGVGVRGAEKLVRPSTRPDTDRRWGRHSTRTAPQSSVRHAARRSPTVRLEHLDIALTIMASPSAADRDRKIAWVFASLSYSWNETTDSRIDVPYAAREKSPVTAGSLVGCVQGLTSSASIVLAIGHPGSVQGTWHSWRQD